MNLTYIISNINKAVYFEKTAFSLKDNGVSIRFILINSKGGDLDLYLQENNFEIEYIACAKISKSLSSVRQCAKYLKQFNTDVVHCHLGLANWIGLWAARFAGVKTRIFTRHSGEPLSIGWKERIIDKIQNKLSTKIVAITKNVERLLIKQGVQPKKIALIHHGFDLRSFSTVSEQEKERIRSSYNSTNKSPVIGVISRWLELKGVHHIIDSFILLLNDYPSAKLCLFGANMNGDYSDEIALKLKALPKENIEIVSFEKNVFALYSLFDVYIHVPINNSCEAFGQTYVEALAAGCPSVFTLSGIGSEFITDNENALVVPYQDVNAIFEATKRLIEDKELREKLKENGQESVKQFNFENYIDKLMKLYA